MLCNSYCFDWFDLAVLTGSIEKCRRKSFPNEQQGIEHDAANQRTTWEGNRIFNNNYFNTHLWNWGMVFLFYFLKFCIISYIMWIYMWLFLHTFILLCNVLRTFIIYCPWKSFHIYFSFTCFLSHSFSFKFTFLSYSSVYHIFLSKQQIDSNVYDITWCSVNFEDQVKFYNSFKG